MHKAPPRRGTREPFDRTEAAPRVFDREYGTGTYRRRIVVRNLDRGRATGELEDDFHHFRVDLAHDGHTVTHVEGTGLRSPWTTCLTAGEPLQMLVGTALSTGPGALHGLDAKRNCTHMFDLAGLLVTHAARRDVDDRVYDIELDDPDPQTGSHTARLWRDGDAVLEWEVRDRAVLAPAEWTEAPLWSGFIAWAADNLDDDLAEAAVALRRAVTISRGRLGDLDEMETAEPLMEVMAGICHSMQPTRVALAVRRKGSARDFTDRAELLLADFDTRR